MGEDIGCGCCDEDKQAPLSSGSQAPLLPSYRAQAGRGQ